MIKFRNWVAVAAHFRRGGPMKHKTTPRGGASNQSRDLIDQGMEELQDERESDTESKDKGGPNGQEGS